MVDTMPISTTISSFVEVEALSNDTMPITKLTSMPCKNGGMILIVCLLFDGVDEP